MTRLRKCDPCAFLSPAKSAEAFAADVEELRRVLAYAPESGLFTWRVRISLRVKVGAIAGEKRRNGYVSLGVFGTRIPAHRLAWIFVYGVHPENDIDHINGMRSDNAIANLRDVTRQVNLQNVKVAQANNLTGFLGVSKHRQRGDGTTKFVARIGHDYKKKHIGVFDTPEAAHAAYLAAKRRLHDGCTL